MSNFCIVRRSKSVGEIHRIIPRPVVSQARQVKAIPRSNRALSIEVYPRLRAAVNDSGGGDGDRAVGEGRGYDRAHARSPWIVTQP